MNLNLLAGVTIHGGNGLSLKITQLLLHREQGDVRNSH
jgi:hypothetical protein